MIFRAFFLSIALIALGACSGNDQNPAQEIQNASEGLPSPISPQTLRDFKASFDQHASGAPSLHILSHTFGSDQRIGQLFVGCNLDGKDERICLLDTGAAASSVPQDSFTQTYEPLGKIYQLIRGEVTCVGDWIGVDSFSAAGYSFGKAQFMRMDSSRYPVSLASQGIAGVIGEDLLFSRGLSLNFKTSQIRFDRIEKSDLLPELFKFNLNNQPLLPVALNGEAVDAVFDTGASFTAVDKHWIREHADQFEEIGQAAERTATGEINRTRIYRAKKLKVGEAEIASPYVIALDFRRMPWLDANTVVILGFNVISQGQWKIDYPTLRWSFERNLP